MKIVRTTLALALIVIALLLALASTYAPTAGEGIVLSLAGLASSLGCLALMMSVH